MTDNVILYNTEDGRSQFRLALSDGTVWLSQAEMAALFETTPQNITQHIRTVYAADELSEGTTVKENLTVQTEGERRIRRRIAVYRLEMVLAVGYRVRSPRGVQFRRPPRRRTSDGGARPRNRSGSRASPNRNDVARSAARQTALSRRGLRQQPIIVAVGQNQTAQRLHVAFVFGADHAGVGNAHQIERRLDPPGPRAGRSHRLVNLPDLNLLPAHRLSGP